MGDVPDFSLGDIVHLKSGSPDLTVISRSKKRALVGWFADGHSYEESYPLAALALNRQPAKVHEIKRG